MTTKTHFSQKEIRWVISGYELGNFRRCKPIPGGTVQTNYFVQTTTGKFVFRCYENRSFGSVLFEVSLIKYLNKKNYPCPKVFKNKAGRFIGIYHEKPCVLFEFVEGKHIRNPTKEQKEQLISKVAELQNITKKYRPKNINRRWNYGIELCQKLARNKAREINTVNSRDKLKWIEFQLSNLELPKSLPKGICHCDFHFSNVLFYREKFKVLIDFDDANYTFLTYDLVGLMDIFIPSLTWDNWRNSKPSYDVFDFKEAKEVLLEYQKSRPLTDNEKRHIFDVYKLSILIDCLWYFQRGTANDFYEKRKIEYLDWLGREKFYSALFE